MALLEREEISRGLVENPMMTWAELGRRVGRHPSTISREVNAHGGRHRYRATVADATASRARKRPRTPRLVADPVLRERVTSDLRGGFSPVAICHRLRADGHSGVCPETIYTTVYGRLLDVQARDCLRWRRPRRRHRCERTLSPTSHVLGEFNQIKDRPASVNDRTEEGHWEGDLIIGARNQSAVISLNERVTRYTKLIDLPNGYKTNDTLAGLCEAFEQIPTHLRRSLTWDRGSEMACWPDLAATYDLDIWFCDPHAPWQRGQNEHGNRQARFWLPRGLNLAATATRPLIHQAEHVLNHTPRRTLNWATPHQRYHAIAH